MECALSDGTLLSRKSCRLFRSLSRLCRRCHQSDHPFLSRFRKGDEHAKHRIGGTTCSEAGRLKGQQGICSPYRKHEDTSVNAFLTDRLDRTGIRRQPDVEMRLSSSPQDLLSLAKSGRLSDIIVAALTFTHSEAARSTLLVVAEACWY